MVGGNHTMVGVGVLVGGGVGVTVGAAGVGSSPGSPAQSVSSKVVSANKQILSPRRREGRRGLLKILCHFHNPTVNIFIKTLPKFVFIGVICG